jgi:hypothetical protein
MAARQRPRWSRVAAALGTCGGGGAGDRETVPGTGRRRWSQGNGAGDGAAALGSCRAAGSCD